MISYISYGSLQTHVLLRNHPTLDGDMLDKGYILACQSSLKSDIVVEVDKDQKGVKDLQKAG